MSKYSETHHLNVDEDGLASVHVAVHLQDADPRIAHLLVMRVLDVASAIADLVPLQSLRPDGVVRPQTSGPCVHYSGDEDPCTYPYGDGVCPHLDDPEILCPLRDSLCAMRGDPESRGDDKGRTPIAQPPELSAVLSRMRDALQVEVPEPAPEPEHPPTYETAAPEWVEPEPEEAPGYAVPAQEKPGRKPHPNAWSDEEEAVIRRAYCAAEAERLYSEAFPDSTRTAAAVTSRWYRLRDAGTLLAPDPLPDFIGDQVPVTQCEEPAALTPEERGAAHPWIGMQVRVLAPPDIATRTGTVIRYSLDPRAMLVALDDSRDRVWLPPEALLLVGAGRRSD